MVSTDDLVCASCGLANRVGANFCGNCGNALPRYLRCGNCGATIDRSHQFCNSCGNSVSTTAGAPTEAIRMSDSTGAVRARAFKMSLPPWVRLASNEFRRRLKPISAALLISGALLVVLAQAYLTLVARGDGDIPSVGAAGLVAGILLFSLGVFGRGEDRVRAGDPLGEVKIAVPQSLAGPLSPARVVLLGVGAALMGILSVRLLSGSESGWDLFLWVPALGAFAAPLVRRPIPWMAATAFLKKHCIDIAVVLALIAIFVALNAHDLANWYYSAIGDEYAHYSFARELAEDGLRRPFDLKGVYSEINPVMSSIYPASLMWLFGTGNFVWKLSLVVSIAATIPGVYVLGHILAGRIAAIIAGATLAFSHYIFAFMHTGYPNTDVLPVIVWSVVLFVLGVRRRSPFLIYAAGVLAGFGLLFNIVARATLPIIAIFAIGHPDIRRRLVHLWPWALGVSLTVLPVLLVNGAEVYSTALVKIVSPSSQHASEYDSVFIRIIANSVQNLLAFNYNPHTSHYVSGALLDPISAVLAALGLGYTLGTLGRWSSRLVLIMFIVIGTGTALLSPYPYVPITRMTSMLIPLSLMSGIAVSYIFRFADRSSLSSSGGESRLPGVPAIATLAVLCAVVLALNATQFWYVTPKVFHHTQEAVAIGAARSEECSGDVGRVAMIGRSTEPLLRPAIESYAGDGAIPHLVDHSQIDAGYAVPIESPLCFIFLHPDDGDIQSFKLGLAAQYPEGRFSTFSNPSGKAAVEVFRPGAG